MIEQRTTEIGELTTAELDAVAGGKLLEAACKGKVFSEVVIGGDGGGTGPNLLGTMMAGAVSGGSGAVT